ncbi:Peroxisomal membrane signal receptor PTS1 [Xanthoria calcicola]
MAFLGGAECSTAGNPLTQFTKHVQDDKSLQRDRLVGSGPTVQDTFRTQRNGLDQEAAMQDFLQQNSQVPPEALKPFAMEQMRRDLDGYRMSSPGASSPAWATEFDPGEQSRLERAFKTSKSSNFVPRGFSPAEFQRFQQMERTQSPRISSPSAQVHGYQRPMGMGYGMSGMGLYSPMSGPQRPMESVVQNKGKDRMVELDDKDWEQQFAEIDAAGKEGERELSDEDIDTLANAAMEAELGDMDRAMFNGEYSHNFDTDAFGNFDGFHHHQRDPNLGDYLFEDSNIFSNAKDPYSEGTRIMSEGGNLSLAALAFEAAVQKTPDHLDAWVALGQAQAQNEKETPAIRALEQALTLDPNNLPALMSLAISYTNEGYEPTAYRTLERWLSTKYPSILPPDQVSQTSEMGFTDRHLLHEKVTSHFIRAAQLSPGGDTKTMDPDVQVGLGVLFYGCEEYSKAVDCFSAALDSTTEGLTNSPPQAHLLWNRLGATLANSGRSEEAIQAYEEALRLCPGFVRARYNLGVSCINIGCPQEAAQHLLGALAMHEVVEREGVQRVREVMGEDVTTGGGGGTGSGSAGVGGLTEGEVRRMARMNQSTNLLETLRRVFTNMGRRDLAERVQGGGVDVESFRGEFDF